MHTLGPLFERNVSEKGFRHGGRSILNGGFDPCFFTPTLPILEPINPVLKPEPQAQNEGADP